MTIEWLEEAKRKKARYFEEMSETGRSLLLRIGGDNPVTKEDWAELYGDTLEFMLNPDSPKDDIAKIFGYVGYFNWVLTDEEMEIIAAERFGDKQL